MKKIVNLLDTIKNSSNSESESADDSDGDESVKYESEYDGNQLQLFLLGGIKTQVPLRVEDSDYSKNDFNLFQKIFRF